MIIDGFAGAGGWDEAIRKAGYDGPLVGIELAEAACRTAEAAGHIRVRADIAAVPVDLIGEGPVDGLVESPPCPTFSSAGSGAGRKLIALLCEAMTRMARGDGEVPAGIAEKAEAILFPHAPKPESAEEWASAQGTMSALSLQPLRWALALRPRWIALEQVPEVLPLWQHLAHVLRGLGYSVWCGVLNSADYGVPQTRRRAILIARRDGQAARAPEATHSERDDDSLFGSLPRWVSMAEALGWDGAALKRDRGRGLAERHGDRESRPMDAPAFTVTCGDGGTGTRMSWVMYTAGQTSGESAGLVPREPSEPSATITGKGTAAWVHTRPATTVCADPRIGHPGHPGHRDRAGGEAQFTRESVRVTVQEAAVLQGFRSDYPWQGTKTQQYQQVGNAIPPPLAAAVLRRLLIDQTAGVAA
ncbi:DNA cytosine methyltransferase [Actinomycetospora aeridis]|uniref:DNA (cytosine-5-)-methyltransferase n=1 Tax=Actinomycetospora aeridis TaxID=3129231 RepID=A0ABU8N3U3_9PSEU